jgi:multiple sugar transport system ATP-binding protein
MTLGDRVAVMRSGVLQQVASPQELYERPVNLFVAGFIGSPAMNFMAGTIESDGLRTSIGLIPVSGAIRQALERSNVGREIIVGIRPESFEDAALVSADLRQHGITFQATIDVVESLGAEKYVYFSRDLGQAVNVAELEELARDSGRAAAGSTETVVARLDPATRITEGETAQLWVDMREVHVFDPGSGQNLTLTDGVPGASSASATTATAPPVDSPAPPGSGPAFGAEADAT